MIQLALYQPDIPQNLGALLRLSACLDAHLHVIEPCGFPLVDKRIERAGMDYIEMARWQRHTSFEAFETWRKDQALRLVILTTKASAPYTNHHFTTDEVILLGRESAGLPEEVHEVADTRLIIPMREGARSLNLAMSAAIVTGEAIRQLHLKEAA